MVSHDYVLCYTKNKKDVFIGKSYEDNSYKYEDEFVSERGKYNLKQPLDCNSISYSSSLDYPIEYEGKTYYPGGDYNQYLERKNGNHLSKDYAWRWSKELYEFGLKNGWIVFSNGRIYTKGYLNAGIEKGADNKYQIVYREKTRKLSTIDFIDNQYSNDIAKKQLSNYQLGIRFDYPKPINLIKELLASYYKKDAIVLDFFSGSGTTADAVLRLNEEDSGTRKFLLIQLPENIEQSNNEKYSTICDVGEERIRRSAKKIKEETNADIDYGFRVYKVDSSNMKDVYYRPNEISQTNLFDMMSNIKEDRTPEDLLTQVILDLGLTLDLKIEEKNILNNKVYYVADNALVACFDSNVNIDIIDEICKCNPLKVVFKDVSFKTDKDKINLEERIRKLSPNTEINIL
jgi:adenine-specific DNA-methyltransferase